MYSSKCANLNVECETLVHRNRLMTTAREAGGRTSELGRWSEWDPKEMEGYPQIFSGDQRDVFCAVLTCHRKNADEEADGATRQHHLFFGVVPGGLLARRPDAHGQDQHVEQHDRDHARHVDHLDGFVLPVLAFRSVLVSQSGAGEFMNKTTAAFGRSASFRRGLSAFVPPARFPRSTVPRTYDVNV
ncbi:hypothetical protein EVAR_85003_1 [Eumeta japonica]|uniref:Uncharacterized protein n=1 Tax=Eumeta variegata TaxID=151549 RepID=A0A4C1W8M0_EUMVA|nr:hypothetical protein EVAR_85003_1 [Eumeta japonica]